MPQQRVTQNMTQFIPAFLIEYSDSSFTNPHEMVLPDDPKDCRGDFTHMGAKYWGLESKRHAATTVVEGRAEMVYDHNAHNWFLIGLKKRATIKKISISTKWYTGNQVRAVSVILKDEKTGLEKEVLTRTSLKPDAEHSFDIAPTPATECLVRCYYEGGIARVNLFGDELEPLPERENILKVARISHVSNDHYGHPEKAVRGERAEMHMIGWESARTGFGEQALFHLAAPARIGEIVVDTYLHRLNPPLTCHVFGVNAPADIEAAMAQAPQWKIIFEGGKEVIPENFQAYMLQQKYLNEDVENKTLFTVALHHPSKSPWQPVLPFASLRADTYHRFRTFDKNGPFTHILYMHYPNGGVHGLKVFAA